MSGDRCLSDPCCEWCGGTGNDPRIPGTFCTDCGGTGHRHLTPGGESP